MAPRSQGHLPTVWRSGKMPRRSMERAVYRNLGANSQDVIVSPGVGLDNGLFDLGAGRVLVITADPISMVPALGPEMSAWLSVNLVASDLSSSGVKPTLASF